MAFASPLGTVLRFQRKLILWRGATIRQALADILDRFRKPWLKAPRVNPTADWAPENPLGDQEGPFRSELFSPDQLSRHAERLAGSHRVSTARSSEKLIPRLRNNERIIDRTYELVTELVHTGVHLPPSSEWLLDNYYVIKEQITLAREHLPRGYSKELPLLTSGAVQGLPRIYHLATELITHVDGRVDAGNLDSFVSGYQRAAPLTIGELWAVPIMLRLALIENASAASRNASPPRAKIASSPNNGPANSSRWPNTIRKISCSYSRT